MSLSNHVLEASDGFINITNYSKDDLAKLSIGDFVKFSGTFYFNTVTNIDISCDNKNFDIKISYTPIIDKNFNFDADTKYSTIFKGIWGALKDYFYPSMYGIGYLGELYAYKLSKDFDKSIQSRWNDMIRRVACTDVNVDNSRMSKCYLATCYAVLTNGVDYQIFTDSNKQNVMDSKPIFEFREYFI